MVHALLAAFGLAALGTRLASGGTFYQQQAANRRLSLLLMLSVALLLAALGFSIGYAYTGAPAGGAAFRDVARITNYFVDMADLPTFFEVRDRYVNTKAPPASTAFQVVKLARDEALFEIEAIAFVAPKKAKPAKKKVAKKSAKKRR